jgi:hypothetical protein
MDVDHVEAPRRQLAAQRGHGTRREGEVRHRAVHRESGSSPERHHVGRQLALLGPGTAMQPRRQTVVRVVRGEDADMVAER